MGACCEPLYWVDVGLFALGGFLARAPPRYSLNGLPALSQDEVVALALELGRPSFEIAGY